MYIDSKAISWLILAGGLFLYLWNITDNQFTYATICMAGSILLWMFIGFTTDSFDNNEFSQVLSGAGFLLAVSVFFLYGLEEMPYPTGAIVFHSDGIAKALGRGIRLLRGAPSELPWESDCCVELAGNEKEPSWRILLAISKA